MDENKMTNYILLALLVVTFVLFSWTCCYMNNATSEAPTQTTVAAFSG